MKKKYGLIGLVILTVIVVGAFVLPRLFQSEKKGDLKKPEQEEYVEGDVKTEDGELPILPAESTASDTDDSEKSELSDADGSKQSETADDMKQQGSETEDSESKDSESSDSPKENDAAIELPFVPYE